MDKDEFERVRAEMARERKRILAEMESARREIRAAVDAARAEIQQARAELQAQMHRARIDMMADPERARDGDRGWWNSLRARPRRRPPHGPRNEGGEPAPVTPRPKPMPTQGGAEAPVD